MMSRLMFVVALAMPVAAFGGDVVRLEKVRLEKQNDAVVVTIDGQPFTTYHTAKSQAKPYFFPVVAANGAVITRPLENPKDHQHHKGIWCAVDEVNGIKFWLEGGRIENVSCDIVEKEGKQAKLKVVNHWMDNERPLLRETATVTVYPSRLLVYQTEFAAIDKPVTFEDTKEGMFAIRLADPLRGKVGGTIVNADGLRGEADCWGKESKWVDYYGELDGKICGVALFDDAKNARKSRYHVRNYGLFAMSPFGQHDYSNKELPAAPLRLEPGQNFRLRYGLYVHEGDTAAGKVEEAYRGFAGGK